MKKTVIKFSLVFLLIALLLTAACATFCLSTQIAKAENVIEVVKAPVSNLEGNATAGKSTICVYDGQNKIVYIPESYFLTSPTTLIEGRIYQVNYGGTTFFLEEAPVTTQITVADDELLYPDVLLNLVDGAAATIGATAITNEYTVKLLGFNEDSSEIYVCATLNGNSLYGFVKADSFAPFAIPYQQKTQAERDALLASKNDNLPIGGNIKPATSVALRVIIIVGIAIPAVIIVLLLFKPSKNERRYAKNSVRRSRGRDEMDYDDARSYNRDDRDRDYDRRERDYDRRDRDYDRDYDRRDRSYDDRDYDRRRDDYDRR